MRGSVRLMPCVLGLCLPLLSGCGFFAGILGSRAPEEGSSIAVYRAAMADFSECGTTTDPARRATMAERLAEAAAIMEAEARPADPDHFFMTDRVRAAAQFCADAVGG